MAKCLTSSLIAIVMFAFFNLVKWSLEKYEIEILGQGHGIQYSQWSHPMPYSNLYKVILKHFSLALAVFQILYIIFSRNWVTLKIYRLRSRYTIFIMAQSTAIKIILEYFSLAYTVFSILHIIYFKKCCDLENIGQRHDSHMAPFDSKYMTSYLMALVMFGDFALSVTIYEIFAKQIKCPKFDLKMKIKVKEEKTGVAPFDWKCLVLYR